MGGLNKVQLIGNIGTDIDYKTTTGGHHVCEFRLATNEKWTDKSGNKQERTEWHRIVVWGQRATTCHKYLGKGKQVYVEGRIQTRKWQDKEGNDKYTTEINAQDVQFLWASDRGRGDTDHYPLPSGNADLPF